MSAATADPVARRAALDAAQATMRTFEQDGRQIRVRDRQTLEAFIMAKMAEAFEDGVRWQKERRG